MRGENAKVRLREVVAQPDTILFVGAGVSAWSGLPTWPGLIAELADFLESHGFSSHLVRRELEQGDLLQAASYGFDLLTPQARASFLRQTCRYGAAQPSPLHRRLATLGPRAFVTTNFDKLLEQALSTERPKLSFQLVNNANLVETGSIIQSRARDFVFKPHGDVDTSDSVVLTREQYRDLQHKKQYAFEAFKTLMASRPVVFVGFGLRDPDFLLIKDTLAAVYMGAAQDHYAITADVDELEGSYWRNNYGIHLISYDKVDSDNTAERHGALLDLLDEVAAAETGGGGPQPPPEDSATLAILRHARRMAQLGPAADVEILPLAASPFPRQGSVVPPWETRVPFMEGDAVSGLQQNRSRLLLTGAPGAGKTFVVRAAVARLGRTVIDEALQGNEGTVTIPAYVDLRDYSGDLWKMIAESFPVGFPFPELVSEGRLSFFIDGLNEVSAQLVEDNTLYNDLWDFLARTRSCAAILVTRFGEEHTEMRLPEIALESIPREYVMAKLDEHGIPAAATSEEFLGLLERPVFYRFCVEHQLWDKRTPHGIYTAVVSGLNQRAQAKFAGLDLMDLFGRVAFDSIEAGDLQIPVAALTGHLDGHGLESSTALALVNWLLAEGMLIPRKDQHVNFFHHSVTEHLAAYDLVTRYRTDPEALTRLLEGRRWDQVVLLSIGFLSEAEQRKFFEKVMETDAELGLRALAYIEEDWERWTAEVLRHLAGLTLSWEDNIDLADVLRETRIAEEHESLLWELARQPESLGGAAVGKTLELGGEQRVRRAVDDLFEHAAEYNRCAAIGNGLRLSIEREGIRYALDRLRDLPLAKATLEELEKDEEAEPLSGLLSGIESALGGIELAELREELQPLTTEASLVLQAVSRSLWDDKSPEAIELTAELLEVMPFRAAVALHFQIAHRDTPPDISCLDPEVHGPLLLNVEDQVEDGWTMDTLRLLARYSEDWLSWTEVQAQEEPSGIRGAALWYAAHQDERFFTALESLHESEPDWPAEPVEMLSMISELEWSEHQELFIALLRERDPGLTSSLLRSVGVWSSRVDAFANTIDADDIGWWMNSLTEDGNREVSSVGHFVALAATPDAVDALLEFFAKGTEKERRTLAYEVLGHINGLRLSEIAEDAIAWAVDDLQATPYEAPEIEDSLLANVATEKFVEDVLLPRLEAADEPLRSNLLAVIRKAGERHRRRYVTTNGELLD